MTVGTWVESNWDPILGYFLEIHLLPCGWYCFIFNSEHDAPNIYEGVWIVGRGSLMLKRWRHLFDPFNHHI